MSVSKLEVVGAMEMVRQWLLANGLNEFGVNADG
jgi:hypothetical protein